jgi:hypothetical protein
LIATVKTSPVEVLCTIRAIHTESIYWQIFKNIAVLIATIETISMEVADNVIARTTGGLEKTVAGNRSTGGL